MLCKFLVRTLQYLKKNCPWNFFSAQNSPELKIHIRNVAQDTSVYYSDFYLPTAVINYCQMFCSLSHYWSEFSVHITTPPTPDFQTFQRPCMWNDGNPWLPYFLEITFNLPTAVINWYSITVKCFVHCHIIGVSSPYTGISWHHDCFALLISVCTALTSQ